MSLEDNQEPSSSDVNGFAQENGLTEEEAKLALTRMRTRGFDRGRYLDSQTARREIIVGENNLLIDTFNISDALLELKNHKYLKGKIPGSILKDEASYIALETNRLNRSKKRTRIELVLKAARKKHENKNKTSK